MQHLRLNVYAADIAGAVTELHAQLARQGDALVELVDVLQPRGLQIVATREQPRSVSAEFMDSFKGSKPGTVRLVFGEFAGRLDLTIDYDSAVSMIHELADWIAENGSESQRLRLSQTIREALEHEGLVEFEYPH